MRLLPIVHRILLIGFLEFMNSINVYETQIRTDEQGRYCLNDLHRAAGGEAKHKPSEWLRTKQAQELVVEIEKAGISAIQSKQQLGTYAVKKLVYAYAMWISPRFHLEVIDAYDNMVTNQNAIALPDFSNPAEAARAWAAQYELTQQANAVIEHQAEKIRNKDLLIRASNEAAIKAGEILVREFVKTNDIINLGEKQFYQWMRAQGYVLKNSCEPIGDYVKRGYFTWKPGELIAGKIRHTLRITPRGQVWLAGRYIAYLDALDRAEVA